MLCTSRGCGSTLKSPSGTSLVKHKSADPFSGRACETKFKINLYASWRSQRARSWGQGFPSRYLRHCGSSQESQHARNRRNATIAGFPHLRHARGSRRGKPSLFDEPKPLGGVLDPGKRPEPKNCLPALNIGEPGSYIQDP